MPLIDLLHKGGIDQAEFLRTAVETTLQALMEAAGDPQIGADRYERTDDRVTPRTGRGTGKPGGGPCTCRFPSGGGAVTFPTSGNRGAAASKP